MTTAWNLTFGDFVTRVLQKTGVLGASETASAADFDLAADVVDGSLKALHADGLLWWAVTTENVAWAAEEATQAVPTGCVDVLFAYWLYGTHEPVRVVERAEYEAIPDKDLTGQPEVLFNDNGTLTLWPVPTASVGELADGLVSGIGTLRLTYQSEIADTDQSAVLDVPKACVKPLIDLMAYEIGPYFGIDTPRLEKDAARATETLRKLRRQIAEPGPVEVDYF